MSDSDVRLPYPFHPYAWQQVFWRQLDELLVEQRLPHALLLSGADGIGKERFAKAFAARLLCQSPRDSVACGQCKSCSLLAAGTHPDFMWLTLETDDKGKTAKAIKVDQVREVVEFAAKSSQMAGWRVVVIIPAHLLNVQAANALLKTLEEPGRETALMLVTSQPLSLMPTLRSRCQQRPLPVPTEAEALAWLVPQTGDEERARLLLALSRGAPLAALALQEADWFSQREALLRDLMQLGQQRQTALATAQRWHGLGAEALLKALLSLMDDMVAAASGVAGVVKHRDLAPIIGRMAGHFAPAALLRFRQGLAERQRLLAGNVQGSALIDATFSDWVALTSR
jgi:DNA polymerase-3 subunit delta'